MRALLLRRHAPIEEWPLEEAEVPIPEPGPGEILVRVSACGLCHTDLHIAEGDLPLLKTPLAPGHQIVGTVREAGRDAGQFTVGERVGVAWLHSTCGLCSFCLSGRENLCVEARFTGYHVDGGYTEYAVVPEAFAYRIPEGFSDQEAAPLLCGGVIGYRALRLSQVRSGKVLGLYGFGSSAHIVIQVARHLGCRVYVFTRSPAHQEMASRLGAEWVGIAGEQAPQELDGGIIFAPAGEIAPLALGALRRGGTLVLAGITMSPIPEMPYALIYGERVLRSVANATRQDAQELLRLTAEIPLRTEVHVYPLAKANEALRMLKRGEIEGSGVLEIAGEERR